MVVVAVRMYECGDGSIPQWLTISDANLAKGVVAEGDGGLKEYW